jgi:drug/metabolite transporter (DMT)-like permease
MQKKMLIPLFSGLVAASIWGGMYVVSKIVLNVIPPFALLTMRLVLGFAALWLVVLVRPAGIKKMSARLFWQIFGVGLTGYGLSLGFQFVGTKLSTAVNGALVTSATPALVLPFACILLKEGITPRKLAAVIVASLGVVAVIDPRTVDLSSSLFLGNMSLLGAALTWALYSVLVRKTVQGLDLIQTSAIMFLGGLPVTVPAGIWELSTQGMGTLTAGIIAGILFLGIVSTAVAMFLWNYAFARLPASSASLTFFAQPVVGVLLGWLCLNEKITPLFLLGGALIAAGILIAVRE